MSVNYYYIVAGLPDLQFNARQLPVSPVDFRTEMKEQLTAADFKLLQTVYAPHDNENLINLIRGRKELFNPAGNLTLEQLQFGLSVPEELPPYMQLFLEENIAGADKLTDRELELQLLNASAIWKMGMSNDFLKEWYTFDINVRNLLAGLNSRKHELDVNLEAVGSNEVSEQVTRSRDHDFGLGTVLPYVIDIIGLFENEHLMLREIELEQARWGWINLLSEAYSFSIEKILAFAIKLRILERISIIQSADGKESLENILNQIKSGHELPEQFA